MYIILLYIFVIDINAFGNSTLPLVLLLGIGKEIICFYFSRMETERVTIVCSQTLCSLFNYLSQYISGKD